MDWFERLTGFREGGYEDTRSRLEVEGRELRSLVYGRRYGIGELELVSLQPVARMERSVFRGDVSMTKSDLDCATLHRGYAISHRMRKPLFLNSAFQPMGE